MVPHVCWNLFTSFPSCIQNGLLNLPVTLHSVNPCSHELLSDSLPSQALARPVQSFAQLISKQLIAAKLDSNGLESEQNSRWIKLRPPPVYLNRSRGSCQFNTVGRRPLRKWQSGDEGISLERNLTL